MAFDFYKKAVDSFLNALINKGYELIEEAQRTKDAANRSYNQRDAYAALVYHNGTLRRKATLDPARAEKQHKGWEKHSIRPAFGREWVDDFISKYKPPMKGFVLVIVNAAFYTRILEEGTQRVAKGGSVHKYRIISQVYSKLHDLKSKFEGSEIIEL